MFESLERATVGEIVATDFRAAGVFERFGIDFCCGGRRSIAEAARSAAVDPALVIQALKALASEAPSDEDVTSWPVARLIDHIVTTHHTYIRQSVPTIAKYLEKLQQVHGARHPELLRVGACFEQMARDLEQHLMKEEQVLYPYIRSLEEADAASEAMPASPFGTVENPIRMMEREHQDAGEDMRVIRELTNGYTTPADGCATFAACMGELERFERDLHRHVHLENNVLFPRAKMLERSACGQA